MYQETEIFVKSVTVPHIELYKFQMPFEDKFSNLLIRQNSGKIIFQKKPLELLANQKIFLGEITEIY